MQELIMAKNLTNGQKKNTILTPSIKKEELHLTILSNHKHIYDLYVLTGELVNFHPHIRKEVADAYRVENPYFVYNDNCSACICEMIVTIYKYYNQKING